ncbi:2-oxoacid:ferredoxin oxidoreductase subunit beta [Aggregatilinea lenta]|uniref:2-oxoacid:ferredoxin oxidoreductase subunit beta n=1 Tax=Aggregatilinea lenta TaxID=913108 RepID=UPI000E5A8199|nr:2-oxoacid:ferredoxin oxidoreductase subunit beta [Aggregatilinea lenta]
MGATRVNLIGLERNDYKGRPSTLCQGCGHNSISNQIIAVCYELSIHPHEIIKLSGIGCSSKSPAYFLGRSHGFNALHGRMPAIATGATTANRDLVAIGVSGDGDTGSIGLGQFKHMVRRNVPVVYIVENNGVYGLTKGQFSATADVGQELKYAGVNELPPIDICIEALAADATFVARSFAGDSKQVRELLKAALSHRGTAVLDIISPCVTFNNHESSTKSYPYGKVHEEPLQDITFVPELEPIQIDAMNPGEQMAVELHDGSHLMLKQLDPDKHDPTNKLAAFRLLEEARQEQQFITGLIYLDENRATLAESSHLVETPLALLPEETLRPPREALDGLMSHLLCCQ